MNDYSLTKLKTGLSLITVPMPQVESLTVMVGVGAGSRYENRQVNGLFHFIEHMAFKGTKKRPSTLDISTLIDSVGGEMNAFTSKEFTGYWLKLNARHKKLAFDILADILTNSLFKAEEIERERGVIIEEINMYEDLPMRRVGEKFERLVFGDNSMGWEIAGTKENIRQIQRNDFLAYLNKLYYPENMVVVVAGKITPREAEKLANDYFGHPNKDIQKITKRIKSASWQNQKKPRFDLFFKKTDQAHFCLGVPGYSLKNPDRFALMVLATILGGGMSSRLFTQIRERRGLAYYVDCVPDFFTDSGYLVAWLGVKLEKLDEAIKVVLDEFNNLVSRKISQKELNKVKEFNKGRLILSLEDSQNVANRYAFQLLLEGKLRSLKETLRLIGKVTAEDVQHVAKDIFRPEKLNLAVIGPYQSKQKFTKILGDF